MTRPPCPRGTAGAEQPLPTSALVPATAPNLRSGRNLWILLWLVTCGDHATHRRKSKMTMMASPKARQALTKLADWAAMEEKADDG